MITGCAVAPALCYGDWLCQWETATFDPPQNEHPLTDHPKIWYRWLRRRPLRLRQIWCKSVDGGLLGAILKITKNAISPQRFDRSLRNLVRWCKMGLLTAATVKNFKFHKSKMADGRHFKNRSIAISLQPFDRFWWNLARWRILAPYSGSTVKISNFWKFKMAAAAILKITKIAISL